MDRLASTEFRREPDAVPAARAFVRHALLPVHMSEDALDRLVLAAAEAINNVVLHAGGESFAVSISRDSSACVLSITDSGPGFFVPARFEMPPADRVDHRGLALMQALVDHVHVASSPNGTAVVLVQGLCANGVVEAADARAQEAQRT